MDGRATFTIAMSSTTMNWTPRSSASANHFRRASAIMVPSFHSSREDLRPYRSCFLFASLNLLTGRPPATLTTNGVQEIRPVLPDGPRSVAGRRAVVPADRPGAPARPEALHRSHPRPARDRHEHPRRAAARPRGVRRHPEAQAAAARAGDGVRAHGVRLRPERGAL